MTTTQALKPAKTHIAEPGRLTLCGRPSTPVKFVSEDQARVLRDGSRLRLCGACDRAMAAKETGK
jgi:hypothetical protein